MVLYHLAKRAMAAGAVALALAGGAAAQGYTDGFRESYYEAFKGKRVAFIPAAMSYDITQAYAGAMQAQADRLGFELVIRDPNWSVEQAVQAAEQLIAEKVDMIVALPLDAQAMNRMVKKANDAGIYWVWVNLKGGPSGDAYSGADHYKVDYEKVELAARMCADRASKKIAYVTGPSNAQSTLAGKAGFSASLANHPELQLVAQQSAEFDANKAKAIAETILKQHPDLCAIVGQWDGEDIGIPPAIAAAGLTGKVHLITSGGGSKSTACDKVADGSYAGYVSFDAGAQAFQVRSVIELLFQQKPRPGTTSHASYTPLRVITADNVANTHCWSLEEVGQPAY